MRVEGQLIFSSSPPMLAAALDGAGLAYVPRGLAEPHFKAGQLVEVLGDWSPSFPGYHIYYPSRRQTTPAFAIILEALRHRSGGRRP